MKLNELKEALARDDMIADRAKTDFIEKVVTELGKIADKSAISNPATQQSTSIPAQPSSTQQATPPNKVAQQAAQIRQQKLKAGGQAAQTQMAQNSVTPPNNIAQQAAQTRQQKLAIAANTADSLALIESGLRMMSPQRPAPRMQTTCTYTGRFMNCF